MKQSKEFLNREFFKFDHANDITIGKGRIVYEPAYEAWILPGGLRTTNRGRAEEVATIINEIFIKQAKDLEAASRRVLK
jgi:hypothetical protein